MWSCLPFVLPILLCADTQETLWLPQSWRQVCNHGLSGGYAFMKFITHTQAHPHTPTHKVHVWEQK